MTDQIERARAFAALHVPGDPLILFNIWDAGSARAVAGTGAKAIATGSWSVAAANGFGDGEQLPIELAMDNLRRIVAAVALPFTVDLEGGYGRAPDAVAACARQAWAAGAIGCNLEDRIVGGEGLHAAGEQAARLAAVRATAPDMFVNARTDLFLASRPEQHADLVGEAISRGRAYADAGANGLFVPGLADEALIARVCREAKLPVNVMMWEGVPPIPRLGELGVARISHAGAPWRIAMNALEAAARAVHAGASAR
jgi:2-methylisocitrate lyase-like PEP mutase family enzyme